MKADRLLAMLLLLQARGRLSAAALAAELEVTPRTVRRDVDSLAAAGVPVYAERGRHGGYALLDEWRTDATGMTADELRALFLFAGGAAADLGLGDTVASALRKLAASQPGVAAPVGGPRVLVEGSGWATGGPPPALAALHAIVESGARARLAYRSAGAIQPAELVVDPLGLVAKAGRWYLVAGIGGDQRLFRVDRVLDVASLPVDADRPPASELAPTWRRLRAAVPGAGGAGDDGPPLEVVARVARPMLATLERLAARAVVAVEADHGEGGLSEADGAVVVRLRYPGVEAARGSLLGFGVAVEVLEPPEVRDAIVAAARELLAQYAAG